MFHKKHYFIENVLKKQDLKLTREKSREKTKQKK